MKYRQLGRSGLSVSELCLGTMVFGEDSTRAADEATAVRMIHRFLDADGNHIDTANVYAGGRSEEIVGKAIKNRRDQVVLATKVRFPMGEGPNELGLSRYHILSSVEDSLRRMQTDTIDLLYMHAWDPLTPLEESLRTCDELVTAGKVRYIGVSNFKAWQLMKALGVSDQYGWVRFRVWYRPVCGGVSTPQRQGLGEVRNLTNGSCIASVPWRWRTVAYIGIRTSSYPDLITLAGYIDRMLDGPTRGAAHGTIVVYIVSSRGHITRLRRISKGCLCAGRHRRGARRHARDGAIWECGNSCQGNQGNCEPKDLVKRGVTH